MLWTRVPYVAEQTILRLGEMRVCENVAAGGRTLQVGWRLCREDARVAMTKMVVVVGGDLARKAF